MVEQVCGDDQYRVGGAAQPTPAHEARHAALVQVNIFLPQIYVFF